METIFDQQEKFMKASDQTTGEYNREQFKLYSKLICEEYNEFIDAIDSHSKFRTEEEPSDEEVEARAEISDALCDLIVVAAGALHSLGVDVNGSWNEVIRSNLAKIDQATGKVIKRSDGKVLKPSGWQPPELTQFVRPCSQNK
jgi:predicted HAD superfamily Cof-like phosphohydrolase